MQRETCQLLSLVLYKEWGLSPGLDIFNWCDRSKPNQRNAGGLAAVKSSRCPEGDGNTKRLLVLWYPGPDLRAGAVRERALQLSRSVIANQSAQGKGFLYRNAVPPVSEIVFEYPL